MKQALKSHRHDQMIELLKRGYTVKEVSQWLDVIPSYVLEHAPDAVNPPSKKIGDLPEIETNPYENYNQKDFISTDLAEFREWVKTYIDPNVPNNARRAMVIRTYEEGMKKLEE